MYSTYSPIDVYSQLRRLFINDAFIGAPETPTMDHQPSAHSSVIEVMGDWISEVFEFDTSVSMI